MADPRFFDRSGPFTAADLADLTGGELKGNIDASKSEFKDVAALDHAGPDQISFLDNIRYKEQFFETRAGLVIVSPAISENARDLPCPVLVCKNPYKAYAQVAAHFYTEAKSGGEISKHAIVDKSADIAEGCDIGAGAVIEAGVKIARNVRIGPGAVIMRNCEIGESSKIGANAIISHALIGNNVRLYPGVSVGQDGFGFAPGPDGHTKVPQLGRVIIEDNVEIGANTTIDRGSGPDTVIGEGSWIDNLVQIGHNVKIGKYCIVIAQVGISGSTILEDNVIMAGQAGIAGHLRIGKGARIAAKSGVMRDVPAGEEQMGYPSIPAKQFFRQIAALSRLARSKKIT